MPIGVQLRPCFGATAESLPALARSWRGGGGLLFPRVSSLLFLRFLSRLHLVQQTRIRTQPHFAQPASAALRPSGYICAAQLLLSRSHLVQQAAFGACSGSMPPGCAASLRYMPLTRYECYGRPHNPVHYCCFSFAFGRVWSWRFAVGLLAQRLDAPSCTASRRYIPL